MKKYLWSLFAVLLVAGTSCQEKIDIEKEREAIKAVIENESNATWARDFAQQSKSFLQDESLVRLSAGKGGYVYREGWEKISSGYLAYFKSNPNPSTNTWKFTNYKIEVYKESAWAVYDAIWHNAEGEFLSDHKCVRFLKKVDGEWKIVFLSWIDTTSYSSGVDFIFYDEEEDHDDGGEE